MGDSQLPGGFTWSRDGDTVRLELPRLAETEHHRLEPMLTRKDAARVAEALRAANELRGPGERAIARILIRHDEGYATETVSEFRYRLLAALVEAGFPRETALLEAPSGDEAVAAPPAAPHGFDAGAETDHGFGLEGEAPPPSGERTTRAGHVPLWRRKFGKRRV